MTTKSSLYVKAFATALIEHLKGNTPKTYRTEGGCDTCGYGGHEVTVGIDEDGVERVIEEFADNYKP